MTDLLYIAIFAACCAVTRALAALCDRLAPGPAPGGENKP